LQVQIDRLDHVGLEVLSFHSFLLDLCFLLVQLLLYYLKCLWVQSDLLILLILYFQWFQLHLYQQLLQCFLWALFLQWVQYFLSILSILSILSVQ
jgi:hypothetical protein